MPLYSPSTGGFYHKSVHGRNVPADVVQITNRHHQELMLAQSQGHEIVATPTGPSVRRHTPDRDAALKRTISRVKREARKRILAFASLEQQSNDNALIAIAALKRGKSDSTAIQSALERRHKIDAVREASNRIEAGLAGHTDDELAAFNAAHAAWPN